MLYSGGASKAAKLIYCQFNFGGLSFQIVLLPEAHRATARGKNGAKMVPLALQVSYSKEWRITSRHQREKHKNTTQMPL